MAGNGSSFTDQSRPPVKWGKSSNLQWLLVPGVNFPAVVSCVRLEMASCTYLFQNRKLSANVRMSRGPLSKTQKYDHVVRGNTVKKSFKAVVWIRVDEMSTANQIHRGLFGVKSQFSGARKNMGTSRSSHPDRTALTDPIHTFSLNTWQNNVGGPNPKDGHSKICVFECWLTCCAWFHRSQESQNTTMSDQKLQTKNGCFALFRLRVACWAQQIKCTLVFWRENSVLLVLQKWWKINFPADIRVNLTNHEWFGVVQSLFVRILGISDECGPIYCFEIRCISQECSKSDRFRLGASQSPSWAHQDTFVGDWVMCSRAWYKHIQN